MKEIVQNVGCTLIFDIFKSYTYMPMKPFFEAKTSYSVAESDCIAIVLH
jgi:hypothetical protein